MEPITLAVHTAYYPEIFKKGFFRFSVGLEDANDLIADLQQAFEKAGIA